MTDEKRTEQAERQWTRQQQQRRERRETEERSKRIVAAEREQAWTEFLSAPTVQHSLNVRLDLTLRQRRNTDLVTNRPSDDQITVRVAPRRISLTDAPNFAPFYYLSEDETRRIAVRVMNRLNKELFGNAARRKNDPQRLTALVCQHDKHTRRHLHVLLALPPTVTLPEFRNALHRARRNEPFIYDVQRIEPVENLAASILYNTNDFKTVSRNAILYIHPQRHSSTNSTPPEGSTSNGTEDSRNDAQHDLSPSHE